MPRNYVPILCHPDSRFAAQRPDSPKSFAPQRTQTSYIADETSNVDTAGLIQSGFGVGSDFFKWDCFYKRMPATKSTNHLVFSFI
jgi:hypothetical protein